jgi:predicted RNA-binding Zn-ribbon protein involved in translation (DUF1610 family)
LSESARSSRVCIRLGREAQPSPCEKARASGLVPPDPKKVENLARNGMEQTALALGMHSGTLAAKRKEFSEFNEATTRARGVPNSLRSRSCGRRVALLYGGAIFACRHCHRLAYRCQREAPHYRAARRAEGIRQRLRWEPGILNDAGDKPKGMRWRTFGRLASEYAVLVGESFGSFSAGPI